MAKRRTQPNIDEPHDMNAPMRSGDVALFLQRLNTSIAVNSTLAEYVRASEAGGQVVTLDPAYGCLPVLAGSDGQPVFLYQFVEALDGAVDYQILRAEFPGLSFGQIAGAFAFLRKLAQFNTRGVDIDQLEDSAVEGSAEFQAQMAAALAQQEVRRVPAGE